jgi:hypothetical protein
MDTNKRLVCSLRLPAPQPALSPFSGLGVSRQGIYSLVSPALKPQSILAATLLAVIAGAQSMPAFAAARPPRDLPIFQSGPAPARNDARLNAPSLHNHVAHLYPVIYVISRYFS